MNNYEYPYQTDGGSWLGAGIIIAWVIIGIVIWIVQAAGYWKMFEKAGQPGWAAIIPIYNVWVMIEIIRRPKNWFWIIAALTAAIILIGWIPILGQIIAFGGGIALLVFQLLISLDMAKVFGKDVTWGILLWLFPYVIAPILGFGSARYVGLPAVTSGYQGPYGGTPGTPPAGYGQPTTSYSPSPGPSTMPPPGYGAAPAAPLTRPLAPPQQGAAQAPAQTAPAPWMTPAAPATNDPAGAAPTHEWAQREPASSEEEPPAGEPATPFSPPSPPTSPPPPKPPAI